MRQSASKITVTTLLLVLILLSGLAVSGCLSSSPNTPEHSTPAVQPTGDASPVTGQVLSSDPGMTETPTPAPAIPGPAVIRTDTGYILTDAPGTSDVVQVQLKAGKANFHIRLPDYTIGESYTLTLTNADGPFSYRSTHEFSGVSGAGDISIVKTIPRDGAYEISLDYGSGWEIEITQ
ncbi:hypothetical protein [Methanocella arvoryzae]|uniref:hypothetical protein n=1 Tax=Methanocella arvoryzae TaxID=1175445 RepID=UPI0011D1A756|nr:hypothetical protein [Methanocella arvoryzae]